MPVSRDANLVASFSRAEDASVYRLGDGRYLVQTVDYFTPVVDDPRAYGAIAAANALSDLYAAGARPVLALALAAFPSDVLPIEVLEQILIGGGEKVAEAGASLSGGHTIDHDVPIYGLAATGFAEEGDLTRHDAAREGDEVVLTKALGVGVLVSAGRADASGIRLRRRRLPEDLLDRMVRQMSALNAVPASLFREFGVRAATDVTGYGLLGHALNLAEASGATLRFSVKAIPLLPMARELAQKGIAPDGSRKNFRNLRPLTRWQCEWSDENFLLLVDAQTSGGILACVPGGRGEEFARRCREAGAADAAVVGRVVPRGEAPLEVFA